MITKTYNTTREKLVNVPLPMETRTYKPVSHEQLIDLTLESIHKAGFALDAEMYSGNSDGQIANARFTISNVNDLDMQLQIGWQNSYNKELSLKFAIGVNIFICSNGSVSGDHGSFKKKHSGEVQGFAPTAIAEYIRAAADSFERMQKDRDQMKNVGLTFADKAAMLGRMFLDAQVISSTQLNIVGRELRLPTFDYNAVDTLWELYQHTTFAMKEEHPRFWIDNHMKAHEFFVNECNGLMVPRSGRGNILVNPITSISANQIALFETNVEKIETAFGKATMFDINPIRHEMG